MVRRMRWRSILRECNRLHRGCNRPHIHTLSIVCHIFFLLDPKALQSNQTKPLVRDPYIFLPSSSTTLQLSHAPQHSDSPCKVCREGYNWNQLILHASIYLRKQSLEILICKMIMMQAESYMLNTLLCKSLNCRFRIGPYLFFSLLPHQSTSIPFFSICW